MIAPKKQSLLVYRYPVPGSPDPETCGTQVSSDGSSHDLAVLPSISYVSHKAGSLAGGLLLTLYGGLLEIANGPL